MYMKNKLRFETMLKNMSQNTFKMPHVANDQFERILTVPKKNMAKVYILTPRSKIPKQKLRRSNLKFKNTNKMNTNKMKNTTSSSVSRDDSNSSFSGCEETFTKGSLPSQRRRMLNQSRTQEFNLKQIRDNINTVQDRSHIRNFENMLEKNFNKTDELLKFDASKLVLPSKPFVRPVYIKNLKAQSRFI